MKPKVTTLIEFPLENFQTDDSNSYNLVSVIVCTKYLIRFSIPEPLQQTLLHLCTTRRQLVRM